MGTETISKHLNTVLLTVMTLILMYGSYSINTLSKHQGELTIQIAVMSEAINSHNMTAGEFIDQIKDNTDRIIALEKGDAVATKDRITKEEVQKQLDELKEFINKNYERKH